MATIYLDERLVVEQEGRSADQHHAPQQQQPRGDLGGSESVTNSGVLHVTRDTRPHLSRSTRAERRMVTTGQENTMQSASGTGM